MQLMAVAVVAKPLQPERFRQRQIATIPEASINRETDLDVSWREASTFPAGRY